MRDRLIELFYDNNVHCDQKIEELADDVIDTVRAKAIKEFAERLCEGRVSNDPVVIAVKCELK